MPSVRPEMTIWGVKGGPSPFFCAKSYFFCYLERHAKIQNRRQTPYGRKVRAWKKERKNNAKFSGHYDRSHTHNVHAHALRSY